MAMLVHIKLTERTSVMQSIKRILFPVEFSGACENAAAHVAFWARVFNAEVVLMHVDVRPVMAMEGIVWEPETESSRERLNQFLVKEFEGLKVQRVLRTGDPAVEIIQYVRNDTADLIMMPTHGMGLFRRFIIGSVTAKVLHDAPCPVWTSAHVREWRPPAVPNLSQVLCAVDLDDAGIHTLRYAGAFASTAGAKLTVAHVVPAVETIPEAYLDRDLRADLIAAATDRLAEMQAIAGTTGVPCVGAGNIGQYIGYAAQSHNASLVIIGRGKKGALGRLRTHDYSIIRECACPVLSI
jgi:nucleotide-binding universal stress UspA family protein